MVIRVSECSTVINTIDSSTARGTNDFISASVSIPPAHCVDSERGGSRDFDVVGSVRNWLRCQRDFRQSSSCLLTAAVRVIIVQTLLHSSTEDTHPTNEK